MADTAASSDADAKLVDKMNKMFLYSLDHPSWVEARKEMQTCHEYKEGKQWTQDELDILKIRKQPPTVDNQVSVTVGKLVGDMVDQPTRIGFRGRNGKADEDLSHLLSDLFLQIRQSNELGFEERTVFENGVTGGFGVYGVSCEFDDLYQPDIKVKAEDEGMIFPDPDSKRYDWNEDAKYVCEAKWIDAEEAGVLYPKVTGELESVLVNSVSAGTAGGQLAAAEQFRGDNFIDQKRRRVRLIQVQYKKYERQKAYLFADERGMLPGDKVTPADLKKAKADGVAFEELDRIKPTICIGLYAAGVLIEHKVTKLKYFTKVPYFCYRKKNGAPYSLITLALSMQDAINKRESKALHLLNTNQVLAERGVIDDKDEVVSELHKPDGVVIFGDGALASNRVKVQNNLQLADTQEKMHQEAKVSFREITGVNPQAYAETGEVRSGVGLQKRFSEANKPVAVVFDNVKRTRHILGRVILDHIINYYTTQKVFLVTEDNSPLGREVTITSDQMSRIKESIYDVIVDDFEDDSTVQQEQYKLFLQYLPQLLPFGPFWIKKALGMSDLRGKDQIISELDQMNAPPPVTPRISIQANINELSAAERGYFYTLMGNPQLGQEVTASGITPTTTTKVTAELAKASIDAKSNSGGVP